VTTENLALWEEVRQPPKDALRPINGGRLKGKTDINPIWRIRVLTEQFGICGVGWYTEIVDRWTNEGADGELMCFVEVHLFIRNGEDWSAPIVGVGGSMLVQQEKGGLHSSDEGWKMAETDALSVALKKLGWGADVYMGLWDGAKYKNGNSRAPIDPSKLADWTAACEEAAGGDLDDFRGWWSKNKEQIKADCGEVGGAQVYELFCKLGREKAHASASV
jgi:hypothetical protein